MKNLKDVILYIDCDGVIFDTINEAYRMMDEMGIDRNNRKLVNSFFINTDWGILFERASELNDAINKIKLLNESNLFKDVIILTKISGNYWEEKIKREVFAELLPGIRVITVHYNLSKTVVLTSGNILVDDEDRNLITWTNAGGISIHFVQGKSDFENDVIDDLLDIVNTKSVKRMQKRK